MAARWASLMIALSMVAVCPAARLSAQQPQAGSNIIDRIVAVVGERAILLSEVDEAINMSRSQGDQIPEDSLGLYTLRRRYLDNMIDEEVLYQRARRDTSINVTDAEVQSAVDGQYRQIRSQFRSEVEFRDALHALFGSPEEYRRWLTEQSRRQAFTQRFISRQKQDGKLRSGTVSDQEMHAYFDEATRGGQVPQMPPTITFRQIIISPKPSEAARQRAIQRADSVRQAIDRGADFSEMARRFSDDVGSRESGGDLGFFRRGQMVRPFEEVAFNLRPGVVSQIVRTEFGYHLILVDRVQPGEVKARHILFAPVISDSSQQAAHGRADSIAALLRGGASIDSLIRIYGDSGEPHVIPMTNRDSLPQGYRQALVTGDPGDVMGPAPLTPEALDRTRWLVAQIIDAKPAHAATFEDLRERIRLQLIDQKGMRNLVDDLKKQTYVDVRL